MSLHHTGCLINYFAERGYLISPDVLPFLLQKSKPELDAILTLIDRKAKNALVISFQTLADVSGQWILIVEGIA